MEEGTDEEKSPEERLRIARERVMEIKEKVTAGGIFINRVPAKTKTQFLAWAKEDFDSDWGFALKWLMDFKEGVIGSQTEMLLQKVEQLEQEVAQLKVSKLSNEEKKTRVIRSVGGTVISERGE